MSISAKCNFVEQQGFRDAVADSCRHLYPALMFQPKLVGVLVIIGLVLQKRVVLSGLLGRPLVECLRTRPEPV